MNILLIDDEAFALKLLARQLANLGFEEVIPCEDARDALAALESGVKAIGLVFCDLQMPQMDGVEFVRHLAHIGYAGGVVLVSGEDERILQAAEKLAKAHAPNVLGALHKPASPEQIQHILDGKPRRVARTPRAARKIYEPDELRRAIAGGELVNYYQPKVALATGRVAGVETLVRWRHPQDGLVFPDQFIAMAEEHGLIDQLTRAVLTGALRQARLWQDAGLSLRVAVNVSMDNLAALEFPDFVAREVGKAGVPLTSPLTTSAPVTRRSPSCATFPSTSSRWIRGFVHGACRDASLRAIFEASVGMGRRLGMKTAAEGVEDQADWDFVCAAGCDLAQGYYIAEPMPGADLVGWMADWDAHRCALAASSQ